MRFLTHLTLHQQFQAMKYLQDLPRETPLGPPTPAADSSEGAFEMRPRLSSRHLNIPPSHFDVSFLF